jgi:hypothetical protein
MFALRLVQIRLGNKCENEFNLFLKGATYLKEDVPDILEGRVTTTQAKMLCGLSECGAPYDQILPNMNDSISRWIHFLEQNNAENFVPLEWASEVSFGTEFEKQVADRIYEMMVLKVLRPDRLLASAKKLMALVLGDEVCQEPVIDL